MAASNGSMAVWCSVKTAGESTEIETHFNYWRIARPGRRSASKSPVGRDFLEVGVLLFNPSKIGHICMYVPFPLTYDMVEDLGPYFVTPDIAQGIFNELLSCSKHSRSSEQWVSLLRADDSLYCRVHVFMKQNETDRLSDIELVNESGGTVIKISPAAVESSIQRLPEGGKLYFRLRIYIREDWQNPFVTVIPPEDRHFQSGYDEVEYVDFRLNEARTLPGPVERLMKKDAENGRVAINRVAFLTAVPVISELSVSNTEFHKNRLLEHDAWNQYVPGGIPNGMMVYHWRKGEPGQMVEDFTAFVKLQTRRTSYGILALYLAIAFCFGIAGNLAASGIQHLVEKYYNG